MKWILGIALIVVLVVVSLQVVRVSKEIQQESLVDEAQPADAIMVPVSYTHLDVYKRQAPGIQQFLGIRAGPQNVAQLIQIQAFATC